MNNAGPGPHSEFYYKTCYNAYAFPDNDGAGGYLPMRIAVVGALIGECCRWLQTSRRSRLYLQEQGDDAHPLPWNHISLHLKQNLTSPLIPIFINDMPYSNTII